MADRQGDGGRTGPEGDSPGNAPSDSLDGRLRKLDAEISAWRARNREREEKEAPRNGKTGMAAALRLSSEFVAGVLVGAAIGWAIDRWAGTSPWGLIIFLLLGFAAGVLNVLRSTGQVAEFGQAGRRRDGTDDE